MDDLHDLHHPLGLHGTDAHGTGLRGLDHRIVASLRGCGADPRVAGAARALSRAGEHGALWLAAGLTAAAVDRRRRRAWLRGTALTAGAHAVSMGVKRVVRRPRPSHVEPLVGTVGRHSFPSSHATSAAAAAVAFGALGAPAAAPLAAAVCLSRLVAGVHYPSDVAAGAALGALTARLGVRWIKEGAHG
ncbi:phosphatase PAP2 family protein [Streptomyces sp. NPDC052012]|uniref:phosphatase PAP2 family protein n=1 Tax=Streptomyces sp. NPDC052012 TaxID=3155051 RepID=UPI00344EFC70